jgi:hypothetical protein
LKVARLTRLRWALVCLHTSRAVPVYTPPSPGP